MRARQIETLSELEAAWRLVAGVLEQDDSHPRNFAFYARHFPHHPELLVVAINSDAGRSSTSTPNAMGGDELCGALLAHAEADHVWIGKLAVLAEHRGSGAGIAMLALVEENAARAGHRRLMLGAARDAEAFYERRGYRPETLERPGSRPQTVFAKTL
jgi:GNAT superfamily N-acetyltransferase